MMEKIEKQILKAMKEDRLGDVIALRHKQLLDKEKDVLLNEIKESEVRDTKQESKNVKS